MAAFLPIAVVLLSLLATGATADSGYGSPTTTTPASPSTTPAPYTPTPATPPPTPPAPTLAPYTPTPATPPPTPTSTPAPYTPPQPATPPPTPATHGSDDDNKKKLVVVRVEGVVLCQSCAKRGSESLEGAAALPGANVTVTCRDCKNRVMAYRRVTADGYSGYFHAEFGVQPVDGYLGKDPLKACFVRLLSSPDCKCNLVTNINDGLLGAPLRDEGKQWVDDRGVRNVVYAAGPLAFRPKECAPTRQY